MRKGYVVVVPEHVWKAQSTPRKPLGQWLIDNMPGGMNFDIPADRTSRREIPFDDGGAGVNGFLLDTNVVSELTRTAPNANVIAFLSEHHDLWLSAIVVHELGFGLQLLPDGQRRDLLSAALSGIFTEYHDRVLPVDRVVAEWAAVFRSQAHRKRRGLDLGDALIAGTARAHDLSVASRNVTDFSGLDVRVINPWEHE